MKKHYHELIEQLNQWDIEYYIKDTPTVSDHVYDIALQELITIEAKCPDLIDPGSPSQRVGPIANSNLPKIKHGSRMLSLANSFNIESTYEFFVKAANLLDTTVDKLDIVSEPKYDGLAISLIYIDGVFTAAVTRGDGDIGEDVTANLKVCKSIPLRLKTNTPPKLVEIRGECFINKHMFITINKEAVINGDRVFANARNAVAGTVRQLDPKVAAKRNIAFIPYGLILWTEDTKPLTYQDEILTLDAYGFNVGHYGRELRKSTLKTFEDDFEFHLRERPNLPFEVDGIVYKLNDIRFHELLGSISRSPNWAIARKFPASQAVTEIIAVDFQVGRTGTLTPVARLKPVLVHGVTVSNATLHNMAEIARLNIHVGDLIELERAGDVIPKIIRVSQPSENGIDIKMPEVCPRCNSPVEQVSGQAAFKCTGGLVCPAQVVERIKYFAARPCMNIIGLGDKLIEALYASGKICNVSDIYYLNINDIVSLEGLGEKSAMNVLDAIERSKRTTFAKFIGSLGIPEVGRGGGVLLAKHFSNWEELRNTTFEHLVTIKDIGPTMANNIVTFISNTNNLAIINRMMEAGVSYANDKKISEAEPYRPLENETWVITGTFTEKTRDELKEILETLGAKVASSVTKKTTWLLAGDMAGSKLNQANMLGVRVINNIDFLHAFGY